MPAAYTPMPSVQVPGFEDIGRLTRHDRLVCDFCSSGQRFACGFLQIPPRGGHPCRRANGSRCRARRGLQPPSGCALPGAHRVGGGVAPAVLPHHRAYGSVPRRFMFGMQIDDTLRSGSRVPVVAVRRWAQPGSCGLLRRSTRGLGHCRLISRRALCQVHVGKVL